MGIFDDDERDEKRNLSIRDKQILYRKAKKRCQNPGCGKRIEFDEMQVGHKKAWSKGGRTTLKNSLCLCYRCNKLQGTDSWATFLKKQGVKDAGTTRKESLSGLTISQLKDLAKKHNIKVRGRIEEDIFESTRLAPTKKQYISKLKNVVTEKEISRIKSAPKPKRKKRRRRDEGFGFW